MIDLHFWPTPNGWKVSIALEELGLPYRVIPVNIGRGEQFKPEFLAISPNNRMPAIVDHAPADGGASISIFESGAILIYLAEKTGLLMPKDVRGRFDVLQWVMWQMGGLGPMSGQAAHFLTTRRRRSPTRVDRYTKKSIASTASWIATSPRVRSSPAPSTPSPISPPGLGWSGTSAWARTSTISLT